MSNLTCNPQNHWLRGPEAAETMRLGWEHEDRLSSTSSPTALIHHRNSGPAQPLPRHLLIPQTLGTCPVPGPKLGSAGDTLLTATVLVLPSSGSQSSRGDRQMV